jgi:hypothetical protein
MGCIVGTFLVALGQGIARNTQIFDNVYMRQPPVDRAHQTKADRDREDIGKLVGWGFTIGGGVFLTVGLGSFIVVLVRVIAHAL